MSPFFESEFFPRVPECGVFVSLIGRAKPGGVLQRAGHTEAAVNLVRLAGLRPLGVICEIMNDNGTMARLPEPRKFARKHRLKICTIADLIEYRRTREKLVERIKSIKTPPPSTRKSSSLAAPAPKWDFGCDRKKPPACLSVVFHECYFLAGQHESARRFQGGAR